MGNEEETGIGTVRRGLLTIKTEVIVEINSLQIALLKGALFTQRDQTLIDNEIKRTIRKIRNLFKEQKEDI